MTSIEEADSWIGRTAVDSEGTQFGMITQIWVDDASGEPAWASIRSAEMGAREALVPLAGAAALGGGRQFAYSRDEVMDAPPVALNGHLEAADQERVSSYYGDPGPAVMSHSSAGWFERAEDAARPAMRSQSTPPQAEAAPPAESQSKRRFRRDAAPSSQKAKGRFRRQPKASDQQPVDLPAPSAEALAGH